MPGSKKTPLYDALPSGKNIVAALDPIPDAAMKEAQFELCDGESYLFMSYASEHVRIAGVKIELFHLSIEDSVRDPLYDEPIERVFQGSYILNAFVEYPDPNHDVGENGIKKSWEAPLLWIPTAELIEKHAPVPAESDVVRFWDVDAQFYKKFGVLEQDIEDSGFFFDVTSADQDGHIFDRASFVGFKCTLKRKTEFTAERRMAND